MLTPETFPAVADVERHGNLLLSAWAPPSHESLAERWTDATVEALMHAADDVFLLGHRPGVLGRVPRGALPEEAWSLLSGLHREAGHDVLHRIPPEAARASSALLHVGDLRVRQRRTNDETGLTRVESTHLGRVLAIASVGAVVRAIQGVAVVAPLQAHLTCVTNPQAGLRQPDARWLRSIRDWTSDQVAITWRGTGITVHAGRETLQVLRANLHQWLPTPS